jgi:outer membrane protein TolC
MMSTLQRTLAFGAMAFILARDAARAQDGSGLRLGDAYRELASANPRIAASRALAQAAASRVSGATRPPDPQIQLGWMNYSLPNLAPMPTTGMAQLQVMQMLPLGGKLSLAGTAAGAQASAADARASDVMWEVRAQAAMAFYDIHAVDRSLAVARETLRLLSNIEKTAESMYRVGDGRQADVLRAQVEIARMAEDTLRMIAMRQTMVARLNTLLDRDAARDVSSTLLPVFPETVPARTAIEDLALANRPMLRAAVNDVRAASASAKLAGKEIWPDLQLGVQLAQRGGEMGSERMGSLMIGASMPVFARDRQLRMRDEARAMARMAEADLASMRAETRGKVAEAYAGLTRARNLSRLYRTTILPQAEAAVSSALSSYRVGKVDFMTLLDDQMTVNRYRQELFVLEADEGKAWAELEMLTARELIDSNSSAAASNVAAKEGAR